MNKHTLKAFEGHVRKLERLAIAGDEDSIRSLACLCLLKEDARNATDLVTGQPIQRQPQEAA